MDLRQLAAVVAVVEHRSFSAAARALHTVQSNVSTHVARLERELEATLIDRSTGLPTEAGAAVVDRARRVQAELEALVADVASMNHETSGVVRLGVIGTTARWLVAELLVALSDAYPRVQVVVVDATTTSLVPQVLNGRLDLAIVALPVRDPDLEAHLLFREDLMVVAPLQHPLAAFERVTLVELARHELLLEPPGTAFRDNLDDQADRVGLRLRPRAEIDGMGLLAALAAEGFGAAILPASAVSHVGSRADPHGWQRVAVDGVVGRSVGVVTRRRRLPSAPARALREVLERVVAQQAADQPGVHPAVPG